jgi:hypothetical protein
MIVPPEPDPLMISKSNRRSGRVRIAEDYPSILRTGGGGDYCFSIINADLPLVACVDLTPSMTISLGPVK